MVEFCCSLCKCCEVGSPSAPMPPLSRPDLPQHLQDIITRLLALARADDKGVRLRTCQLLQLIINNQVRQPEGLQASLENKGSLEVCRDSTVWS